MTLKTSKHTYPRAPLSQCMVAAMAILGFFWPAFAGSPQVDPLFRFKGDFGLRVDLDANLPTFVSDGRPDAEDRYGARFYIRATDLALQNNDAFQVLVGLNAADEEQFRVIIERSGGVDRINVQARLDGGTFDELSAGARPTLPSGWHAIEVIWLSAAGSGSMTLFLNGAEAAALTNLTNGAGEISAIRFGVVSGPAQTPAGNLLLDDFDSRRDTIAGVLCFTETEFNGFFPDWPALNMIRLLEYQARRCP